MKIYFLHTGHSKLISSALLFIFSVHIVACFLCLKVCFQTLSTVLQIESHFPFDIIEEMSQISFQNFNVDSGSYQQIIPKIAHYFLFSQKVCWEAIVKSLNNFLSRIVNLISGQHLWSSHLTKEEVLTQYIFMSWIWISVESKWLTWMLNCKWFFFI